MSNMLGKSGKRHCSRKLPGGSYVGGLPIKGRRARAQETQTVRQEVDRD